MEKEKRATLLESIAQQKINKTLITVLLIICAGFSGFFSVRGTLALMGTGIEIFSNDIFAYIFSCVINGASIFFIVNLLFGFLGKQFGNKSSHMKYALCVFLIPAYFLSGIVKLLYFVYPFLFAYGEIFIEFVFQTIFVSLFTAFCCNKFFYKQDYHKVTLIIMGTFLVLSAVLSGASLLSGAVW